MVKMNRLTCFQVPESPNPHPAPQIKVKGEPAPTFTWSKEGKVVEAAEGVVLQTVTEHPDPAEQSNIVTLQLLRCSAALSSDFCCLLLSPVLPPPTPPNPTAQDADGGRG